MKLSMYKGSSGWIGRIEEEMSNFIKSDYELTHMRKMSDNLASIRGGFQVLNLDRAASIL